MSSSASGPARPLGMVLVAVCVGVLSAGHALAFSDGQAAYLVLGQPDFTTGTAATTSTKMSQPSGVAVDAASGKVFVADDVNNRVLRFASLASLTNGFPAEAALGQPDLVSGTAGTGLDRMSGPSAVHVDSSGRLWVADQSNHRVLRFDSAATLASGATANAFLGTTATSGCSVARVNFPGGVHAASNGTLWVADSANHRVLKFTSAATLANNAPASGVFGQPNFVTCTGATTATGMNFPAAVYVDAGGRLWVADGFNHRVLRFDNAASLGNFPSASGVLGQANLTSAVTALSQSGMNFPAGVFGDATGSLFVSDALNHRVLIHDNAAAKSNGANADNVLGQADFTTGNPGLTASGLNFPQGLAFDDSLGVLLVPDRDNNRVLGFEAAACGDNVLDAGEDCDDGNVAGGDCCDASCQFEAEDSPCGDTGDTECDDPDTCDGAGVCLDNFVEVDSLCGDAGSECTNQDACDGNGGCVDNGHVGAGMPCGDTGTDCVLPDACDGAGGCTDNGFVGSGLPCDPDASACTEDACDGAGTCTHELPPCGNETFTGATIKIKDGGSNPSASVVGLKLTRGNLALAELGDPTSSEDYAVCVYDNDGPVTELNVAGGAQCGAEACWAFTGPAGDETGAKFKDKQNPPVHDGLKIIKAKTSSSGKALVKVTGKGANLPAPALNISYPVEARVVNESGACFGITFVAGDEKANDGVQFKAVRR